MNISMPVILASASPRRQELLRLIFPSFEVCPSTAEEGLSEPVNIKPEELPEFWAYQKAKDIAERHPDALVIGSDTAVLVPVDESGKVKVLGKPHNTQEAVDMLRLLSGKEHQVVTACCIYIRGKGYCFTETAKVSFYPLSEEEIETYVATGEPMDKAGAYGVQGYGALLVKEIDGDFYTVMGLPVARLYRYLRQLL